MKRFSVPIIWMFACVVIAHSQEVNGHRIINVTFDTSAPHQLEINRGRLVWVDTDINTSSLNLKYYSGAEITKIDSGRQGIRAAIDGDYIAWNTEGGEVRSYNLRTWSTSLIGPSYAPGSAEVISVANGYLAYARTVSPAGTEIVVRNLASGSDTVFHPTTWNTSPSIHHRQVAWVGGQLEASTTPTDIFYYDGTGVRNISNAGGLRCDEPILRDGFVVWRELSPSFSRIRVFNGDSTLTLAQATGFTRIAGYDVSGGIAIAGMTDTLSGTSVIAVYNSSTGQISTLGDSARISSPHIDNRTISWASGTGPSKVLKIHHMASGITETLGAADNPVIDDDEIAWTLGDAVEMRKPVTYEKLTADLNNGWAQTRFKEIDNGRMIWGNFEQSLNARLFASNGTSTTQLTDSILYKDFIMANEGYMIWREDFNNLWLYDGTGSPVRIVDSLQCENMYTAGGSIGFHGFRINAGNNIQQAWLYRIASSTLMQLTNDTSSTVLNGITLVEDNTACWYRDDGVSNMLMYYNGSTTKSLSDSTIGNKFSYRGSVIAWDEQRNGVRQVKTYNTATGATVQVTNGTVDAVSPITDGAHLVWFEQDTTGPTMCYYDVSTALKTRVTHLSDQSFRWNWLSNGRIAWSQHGEVYVFDGRSITRLTDSGGFRPNVDPYVDNETVLWKQDSPVPGIPRYGDIFRGKLQAHVAFDAENITGAAPLTVSFKNRSWEGVQSSLWDLGDGTTSSLENPVHTYTIPGTYSVTLTVNGIPGSVSEQKLHLVRVLSTLSVSGSWEIVPQRFALYQNYPNPFNPTTKVSFSVPVTSHVSLRVFDALGRSVATLVDGTIAVGNHHATLDGSSLASGIYFCRMEAQSEDLLSRYVWTIKMMLLR